MRTICITKPDLDTCLTGMILGIVANDDILECLESAPDNLLADRNVICIEAGGTGTAELNNFDHHNPHEYLPPACKQAYAAMGEGSAHLERLVEYVSLVDEGRSLPRLVPFPSLSALFSGMRFTVSGITAQFQEGIRLLGEVMDRGFDPFSAIPVLNHWQPYIQSKLNNRTRLLEAATSAPVRAYNTVTGRRIGYQNLEHGAPSAIGGIGRIYSLGYEIAVISDANFCGSGSKKITIASRKGPVADILPYLNSLEQGWGGRATIIGSPRIGTALHNETVLRLVCDHL